MSKYVEYFQAEVSGWQKKLMVADLVISSWMSVQRTWAHLNSIFTNSHDIRCQLANDAERFQGIHTDFQVMGEQGPRSTVFAVQPPHSTLTLCFLCALVFFLIPSCVIELDDGGGEGQ